MKYYLDVGANDGSSSFHWAWASEENMVYAFEPNPEMVAAIQAKVVAGKLQHRYNLLEVAVSDYEGVAKFNVCTTHDRGCSSLLDLSEKANTEWGGRRDMVPASEIHVNVIRLDSLPFIQRLEEIEYLHVDTQGSDLKVLIGLGEHLKKVRAGVVEAANKPDILYKGQNTAEETIKFLEENGFKIDSIRSNDAQHNEVNIHFTRIKP
jgi:FkbM family methyltransferase